MGNYRDWETVAQSRYRAGRPVSQSRYFFISYKNLNGKREGV